MHALMLVYIRVHARVDRKRAVVDLQTFQKADGVAAIGKAMFGLRRLQQREAFGFHGPKRGLWVTTHTKHAHEMGGGGGGTGKAAA